MPFRLQTSSDPNNPNWKNPEAISIYDNGWKTTQVGYVYDMGWKVVFPDPIIPSISLALGPISTRTSVYTEFDLINSDYIIVQLFAGSNQSNLLQSQTIDTNHNITDREPVTFNGLSSDTTYNIKVTAYSITENTAVFLTGTFTTPPSVNLTATPYSDLSGASVSWVTTRQSRWRVIIRRTSDQSEVYRSSLDLQTGTISSVNALFGAIANTQYTVQLDLEFTGGGVATEYVNFTTPNVVQPSITSLSAPSTCSTITANWTGNSYVTAEVSLYQASFNTGSNSFEFGQRLVGPVTYGTSTTSHTFTGLTPQEVYGLLLTLISSTGQSITSTTYLGQVWISSTKAPSANAPTNLTATSDYWGKNASFTWTASTANCTTVSGYRLEYKLSTSSTWTDLSNNIASNATSFSVGSEFDSIFLPNRTYNFRLYAKTASYGEGPPASVNLTMNNNPYAVQITGTNTIETSSTSTLTAQLVNAAYENLSRSGFVISWSFIAGPPPGAAGSSVSPTSSTTNSSGQATTTFSSSTNSGEGTVYATTSGISTFGGGQRTMAVTLRAGLTPILSATRTNFGYDVTHSNYNSSWSYSGIVTGSGFNFDNIWNDGFYTIVIRPTNSAAPVASRNALVSVTCTQGTWTAQPSATTRVTSTRPGYFAGIGEVTNSPTGTLSYSYTWYYGNGELLGTGQTRNITSAMRGRNVYCTVIATRTGGVQSEPVSSNTISIPA